MKHPPLVLTCSHGTPKSQVCPKCAALRICKDADQAAEAQRAAAAAQASKTA